MYKKYNNIDFCLNLLYDFLYNSEKKCYNAKHTPVTSITLNDIKKNKNFNKSLIFKDIEFTLKNILNSN